ncbi:hypothetical protein [Desulfovibrio litoralis]|uniref:Uncharacterized protein n=1 Tax=Desulfovibrio litoralis DSM 11393 TaxID=1121455 RepID=A0A1M7SW29_9BACT|nr:hypothetical protein [Desulfovibrio litoralis]SHN62661.1 hypothetical protein SAMN02745728_01291 [Desulfovibrio litoralis DSM 11393]
MYELSSSSFPHVVVLVVFSTTEKCATQIEDMNKKSDGTGQSKPHFGKVGRSYLFLRNKNHVAFMIFTGRTAQIELVPLHKAGKDILYNCFAQ